MMAEISLGILPASGDFLVDGPRAEQVHGWILTPCPFFSTDNYKIYMGFIIREFLELML